MTKQVSLSRRCLVFCWTAVAILVILFALLVSVSRMLMPLIADYRTDIERLASEQLGRSLKIGEINAEWVGLWPKVHLSNVQIQSQSGKQDWVQVNEAWLSVDLLSLLFKRQFDTRDVKVEGLVLNVVRKGAAEYSVNGETFRVDQSSPRDQSGLLNWFFTREQLQFEGGQFTYSDPGRESREVVLLDVNLTLQNDGDLHHAYGGFVVPHLRQSQLEFVLDMRGDMLRPQEVVNDFYLQGDVHISSGLRIWLKPYVNIEQGDIKLKLWGRGPLQRLESISADVDAQDLVWSLPGEEKPAARHEIEQLQSRFFWKRQPLGWDFVMEDLTLVRHGFKWPQSNTRLIYRSESDDAFMLEGSLGFIRLEDVEDILTASLPSSLALRDTLARLRLSGSLQDSQFSITYADGRARDFYLASRFKDVGFDRYEKLPGARGLDGSLHMDATQGVLQLQSQQAVLDMGDLFSDRLQVTELHGDVFWSKQDDGLNLSFAGLRAENDDISTRSRAQIHIPASGESPFIDMSMDFSAGVAASTPRYLPRKIMGKKTVKWLDKAFIKGRVSQGKMLFHGRGADFPFHNNGGTFLVDFDVEDLQLNYAKDWPHLQQVNANVRFTDNALAVKLHEGNVMQLNVLPSVLKIDALGRKAILDMDIKVAGPSQRMIEYLHKSPAGRQARDFLADIKVNGNMTSHIGISLPLAKASQYQLQGYTQFKSGSFQQKGWQYQLSDVQGKLRYKTEAQKLAFYSDDLRARFMGKQAKLRINTSVRRKQASLVTVDLVARLGLAQLLKDYLPPEQAIFSGESEWNIQVKLQEGANSVVLESDLQGEQITLPDGFAKGAGNKRPLRIVAQLGANQVDSVRLYHGELLNAVFKLSSNTKKVTFDRGQFHFGKAKVKLPDNPGFVITGKLNSLNVGAWREHFAQDGKQTQPLSLLNMLNQVNLSIGLLTLGQHQYNGLSIIATRRTSDILLTLGARELAGEVRIPLQDQQTQKLVMNLKYLRLKTADDKQDTSILDPRGLPAMRIVADAFHLNDRLLGRFELEAEKINEGLNFSQLLLKGDVLEIKASGSWLFKQSWHESNFDVNFNTAAIGKALQLFNFDAGIDDGQAQAQLTASWSGPPHWFEMKRLNGNLKLKINKGHLKDVDPGAGRLFGLLSIQSLQRRLTLDFSDLFKKGLSFDKIEGSFRIADGDAFTNDLQMDAPAARIDFNGRIGLAAEDYDEEIIVTPKLSSSIPVLGLAAGPQVAIGLFLTEKILRKDIDKISRTRYTLSGSWENPQIKRLDVADDDDDNEP